MALANGEPLRECRGARARSRASRVLSKRPAPPLLASSLLLVATLLAGPPARASSMARDAVALCHRAAFVGADAAAGLIDSGLALAEAAVAGDPDDPIGHFAIFCNLAKRMRLRGLGLQTIADLWRAHREVDRSLALDPGYADALAAKGALLYYSPRFAGGDVGAGERLIRSALAIDPDNPTRLVLVDLLVHREAVDQARREAARSLAAVRASADLNVRAGARALLDHLCTRDWPPAVAEVLRAAC
jgi:hypothetical protein